MEIAKSGPGLLGAMSQSAEADVKTGDPRKDKYATLIRKAARKHGVPIKIAKAVVEVESNFNAKARGRAGEVGLMQIKPATARGMGYRGSTKALYRPETNLEWGMKYLAGAHERANGDLCGTILRYNAGHYAKRMNPISRRYCTKVKRILASS
ncbi:lytic transglycosylase domain-containing protein [Roseibium denhamense]|nr:lytic transglycosylase domain-containing protein [Roseibium denhamense]